MAKPVKPDAFITLICVTIALAVWLLLTVAVLRLVMRFVDGVL